MIPELTYDAEMGGQFDTKLSVKLGGFQTHLDASCVSCHSEEL